MDILFFAQSNLVELVSPDNASRLPAFLRYKILEIELWRGIASLLILIAGFTLKKFLEVVVVRKLVSVFSKTSFKYDELVIRALGKPLSAFVIVGCLYLAVQVIALGLVLDDEW